MSVKITEVADIRPGYQFRKKIEPVQRGTHRAIQVSDFDRNRMLQADNLARVNLDNLDVRHLVRKGDVLFLTRGHRNWAAAIIDDLADTVAVGHFLVITPNKSVLPEYLAWYINQVPVQDYLTQNARRGSHMPLVSKSSFEQLPVEVPDLSTQTSIVELSNLALKEQKLLEDLHAKREKLIIAVCLNAIKINIKDKEK